MPIVCPRGGCSGKGGIEHNSKWEGLSWHSNGNNKYTGKCSNATMSIAVRWREGRGGSRVGAVLTF